MILLKVSGRKTFGISQASLSMESENLFYQRTPCGLERLVLHQSPPLQARPPSLPRKTTVAGWSHRRPPSFAVTSTLLPDGVKAFVVSTLPASLEPYFFALSCHAVPCEHTPPASLGRPPVPADTPASSLDHWIHSLTPRSYQRGFSDLPHSLLGSATEAIATPRS